MNFFNNLGFFFGYMNDATKELVEGVRKDTKEFKTDMKDIIKEGNPKLGVLIEHTDRLNQSSKNFFDIVTGKKLTFKQFDLDSLVIGDHLSVSRFPYSHHGLYIGSNQVLHFSSERIIEEIDLESFIESGSDIIIVNSLITYSPETVVSRGISRVGEENYNLLFNNCEHFVNWSRSGSEWSDSI